MAPGNAKRDHMLLNPDRLTGRYRDDRAAEVMGKTVEFFENRGKVALNATSTTGSGPTDFPWPRPHHVPRLPAGA